MPQSKSIFAILLALSLLISRAQGVFWNPASWFRKQVIGYAMVSEEQAKLINKDNKLQIEGSSSAGSIGAGFYMLNKPSGWEAIEGSWYCAIKARESRIKDISKVWIPKEYEKRTGLITSHQELWYQHDEVAILEYIAKYVWMFEPKAPEAAKKALRFSWVMGFSEWQLQMLIPTTVLNDNYLKLWAKCFDSEDNLKKFSADVIPWDDQNKWDIKGQRGHTGWWYSMRRNRRVHRTEGGLLL